MPKRVSNELRETFGNQISKLITDSGLSQEDAAKELGIKYPNLNSIINGRHTPSPDLMIRIAKRFNVSIDYIYGRE